jgi:hypothetical protein
MDKLDKFSCNNCPCELHNGKGIPNLNIHGNIVCYRDCSRCGKKNDMTLLCLDCKKKLNPITAAYYPKLLAYFDYPDKGFEFLHGRYNCDHYSMANHRDRNPNVSRIAEKIAVILRSENISKLYDYDAVYGKKCCCSGCKDDKENNTYDEAAPVYYGSSFDLTPRCRFSRCKCGLMLSGLGSTTFCRACEF